MANPHKGEYSFEVDGKSYTLLFSADTMCDLEERLDKSMGQISDLMSDPATMSMRTVRQFFFAGLAAKHGHLDQETQHLLFKALTPVEAMQHVVKSFSMAFAEAEGGEASPPKEAAQANGTGRPSTATGSN
jgi:hypothetical protein